MLELGALPSGVHELVAKEVGYVPMSQRLTDSCSVVGMNFNFALCNAFGYMCLTFYYYSLYFSPYIHDLYEEVGSLSENSLTPCRSTTVIRFPSDPMICSMYSKDFFFHPC